MVRRTFQTINSKSNPQCYVCPDPLCQQLRSPPHKYPRMSTSCTRRTAGLLVRTTATCCRCLHTIAKDRTPIFLIWFGSELAIPKKCCNEHCKHEMKTCAACSKRSACWYLFRECWGCGMLLPKGTASCPRPCQMWIEPESERYWWVATKTMGGREDKYEKVEYYG